MRSKNFSLSLSLSLLSHNLWWHFHDNLVSVFNCNCLIILQVHLWQLHWVGWPRCIYSYHTERLRELYQRRNSGQLKLPLHTEAQSILFVAHNQHLTTDNLWTKLAYHKSTSTSVQSILYLKFLAWTLPTNDWQNYGLAPKKFVGSPQKPLTMSMVCAHAHVWVWDMKWVSKEHRYCHF